MLNIRIFKCHFLKISNRLLLEKLIFTQLVKNFSAI